MPTTFTAAGPEDLLAAVPIVLGFQPHASLVMLTFAGPHPFHARVDLPPRGDRAALDDTAELMLRPVLDNDVGIVAFVLYTADALLARRLGRRLLRRFLRADVPVLDCLRADEGRWWSALGDDPRVPVGGVPYDAGAHPFRAQAVFDGLVTLGSREELAASLASDPAGVAAVERVLPWVEPPAATGLGALVAGGLGVRAVLSPREVAVLLVGLAAGWDDARLGMSRERAPAQVRLWTEVVRRAPERLVADPAALLALAAWLAGHGALAWCAVDRCLGVEPSHPLGQMVATMLTEAVPPQRWKSETRAPEAPSG